MTYFIDRRLNNKNKSLVNRQRFLRRYKQQIKQAISTSIEKRSVTDIHHGESVSIPTKDIREPLFQQGTGGIQQRIHPGNDQFIPHDRIERQSNTNSESGNDSTNTEDLETDQFIFELSKDEYLDLLFDDLALPNLHKTDKHQIVEYRTTHAGYSVRGNPANISVLRSMRQAIARRRAMTASKRKTIIKLQQQLAYLQTHEPAQPLEEKRIISEINTLQQRIAKVPFLDSMDIRYRYFEPRIEHSSQAVMFCLMDVSGSMDQPTKEIAKRFYILLYLFLSRTYQHIDVVYIRHHTQAKEVNEHDFFYSQETGGTIVSSAIILMQEIIKERYPISQWNIYAAQASDGDNWADDSPLCYELLANTILPTLQYYCYIEITQRAHQTLWRQYEQLHEKFAQQFSMKQIKDIHDIYPIFRELFKIRHK